MSQRRTLIFASLFGALAVAFGAFGAHTLKGLLLANGRNETYEMAVRYHFFHSLVLLGTGILMDKFPSLKTASWLFISGTMIFCGSLYTLALTGQAWWGAVTPFGGVFLLAGWMAMGITFIKK